MLRLPPALRHAVGIGLIYAVVGALWILSSDRLVEAMAPDRIWLSWAQTLKGWIFVAISAALIVALVHRAVSCELAALDALRKSLGESELLLGEIHHRVRNNLQVVVTLLSLEASKLEPGERRAVFDDTISRIQAMGLIHEHLYQRNDSGAIELEAYVRDLCEALALALGRRGIRLECRVPSIRCPIEVAVPLAMVLVELITNAFKHAFPAGARGTMWVEIEKHGEMLKLCVSDDGIGIPAPLSEGTGFRLVRVISGQEPSILRRENGGTCVRVALSCR